MPSHSQVTKSFTGHRDYGKYRPLGAKGPWGGVAFCLKAFSYL